MNMCVFGGVWRIFFIVNWFSHFLATKKITLQPILFVNFGPPMHNNCFECTEMKWQKATKKTLYEIAESLFRYVQTGTAAFMFQI